MIKLAYSLLNPVTHDVKPNYPTLIKMLRRLCVGSASVLFWVACVSEGFAQSSCPSGKGRAIVAPLGYAYVISPRQSTVLQTTPLLKWNQITTQNTTTPVTYTVQVLNSQNEVMWEMETSQTEVRYNANGKGIPLVAGGEYTLNVRVNLPQRDNNSANRDPQGLSESAFFQVITPQNHLFLRNSLAAVPPNSLSPQVEAELKANIYASYGMNDEAVNLLERNIAQGGSNTNLARLYYQTGSLYGNVGLWQLAQNHYEKGLSLSIKANQPELIAAFRLQLMETYSMQTSPINIRKAIEMLEQSLSYYESVGDQNTLDYIRRNLAILREYNAPNLTRS